MIGLRKGPGSPRGASSSGRSPSAERVTLDKAKFNLELIDKNLPWTYSLLLGYDLWMEVFEVFCCYQMHVHCLLFVLVLSK